MTQHTKPIRTAVVGVGNCCSALVQGLAFYAGDKDIPHGVMRNDVGGYRPGDIEIVAAFDIDERKVGRPLGEAIFALPNCAKVFSDEVPANLPTVVMGPVLDGCAPHMLTLPADRAFRPADLPAVDVAQVLRDSGAEVLVNYLPVGSQQAVEHYAEACLAAGVAMVNCMPVFIASDALWAKRFVDAGLPIIGDDIKSQVGATILHRTIAELFERRGCSVDRTYQLNTGGNTDFLNMKAEDRLSSKRQSKTNAVQSQLCEPLDDTNIHVGPSDYVAWQKDNKVAFIRIEGQGFGGAPIELEMRLSVQDSPNSAGVVIDAVRCLRVARDRGLAGPVLAPSAAYMKSPPEQMTDTDAQVAVDRFLKPTD